MSLTLIFQSGLCSSSELETSRGSIRIQHLTGANHHPATESAAARFPRLEECAHFHYEFAEIGPLQVQLNVTTQLSFCHPPPKFSSLILNFNQKYT